MKRRIAIIFVFVLALGALAAFAVSRFNFSALNEPGKTETYLATQTKHFLISRASRAAMPAESSRTLASAAEGEQLYGAECAMCHGLDGHTPADSGRWMYPRAADLTSAEIQQYSDRELF